MAKGTDSSKRIETIAKGRQGDEDEIFSEEQTSHSCIIQ